MRRQAGLRNIQEGNEFREQKSNRIWDWEKCNIFFGHEQTLDGLQTLESWQVMLVTSIGHPDFFLRAMGNSWRFLSPVEFRLVDFKKYFHIANTPNKPLNYLRNLDSRVRERHVRMEQMEPFHSVCLHRRLGRTPERPKSNYTSTLDPCLNHKECVLQALFSNWG